jgi:hypothetical protein
MPAGVAVVSPIGRWVVVAATELIGPFVGCCAWACSISDSVTDSPFGSLTMLQLPDDPFVSRELVHDPIRPVTSSDAVNHLVVQTDDLEATITDLAARGVQADGRPSSDRGCGRPG